MGAFGIQLLALKILAVIFVLLTFSINSRKKIIPAVLFIGVASIVIHSMMNGVDGLSYSAGGIGLALILAAPLGLILVKSKSRFIYSAAAGSMAGPMGSVALFLILYLFLAARMLYRSNPPSTYTHPWIFMPAGPDSKIDSSIKSQLARIEIARFDRENSAPFEEAENSKAPHRRDRMESCWPMILGVSTLAVLISGMIT